MEKLFVKYKQHYEITNYILIAILIAVSCFIKNFCYVPLIFASLLALFYGLNENTKLILFLYPFQALYRNLTFNAFYVFIGAALAKIFIIYVADIVKNRKKLNFKLLTVLLLMFIYLILPVHDISFADSLEFLLLFLAIYFVYEFRRDLNFVELTKYFCLGILASCCFGLFGYISPYLHSILRVVFAPKRHIIRFTALFVHPNNLATNSIIALSALSVLFYLNKIKPLNFYLLFFPIYIFAILALARCFVLTFFILIFLIVVLNLCKYSHKGLKKIGVFLLLLLVVSACLFNPYRIIFERADEGIASQPLPTDQETLDEIYNGEFIYDPGRMGLWKLYLTDWSSSATTILFGRGVSRVRIGQMAPHNAFIQYLWCNGLVGYLFILALIYVMADMKKLKRNLPTLAFILPVLAVFFIDPLYKLQRLILIIMVLSGLGVAKDEPLIEQKAEKELG